MTIGLVIYGTVQAFMHAFFGERAYKIPDLLLKYHELYHKLKKERNDKNSTDQ